MPISGLSCAQNKIKKFLLLTLVPRNSLFLPLWDSLSYDEANDKPETSSRDKPGWLAQAFRSLAIFMQLIVVKGLYCLWLQNSLGNIIICAGTLCLFNCKSIGSINQAVQSQIEGTWKIIFQCWSVLPTSNSLFPPTMCVIYSKDFISNLSFNLTH